MGGQTKKKDEALKGTNQRKHRRATRGVNTKKKPILWERISYEKQNEDGTVKERGTYNVTVPPNTMWNPHDKHRNNPKEAEAPFDALHLDWREEMMYHAAETGAKIATEQLPNGRYLYTVYEEETVEIDGVKNIRHKDLYSVESAKKLMLNKKGRKRG